MKKVLFMLLCVVIVSTTRSFALPRFALKSGDITCGGCHVDPSGGGLRTAGGQSYETNELPMWKRGDNFTSSLGNSIRFGIDFREQYLSFSEKTPVYAPLDSNVSSSPKQTGTNTATSNTFHAMTFALEMSASLTNSVMASIRYDPTTSVPFQGFGIWHVVHSSGEVIESGDVVGDVYVKVGAFMPSFGIRFDDHTLYVRGGNSSVSQFGGAGLFWAPGYRDVGGELGFSFIDHIGIQVGLYNGSEPSIFTNFRNPMGDQSYAMAIRGNVAGEIIKNVLSGEIGYSIYDHSGTSTFGAAGNLSLSAIHGGVYIGPVSILAEYDNGKNVYQASSGNWMPSVQAMSVEGAYHAVKGLDLILRYETFKDYTDPDETNIDVNVKDRITVGAQWFPLRFLELRPEFRVATLEIPSQFGNAFRVTDTQTTFLLQTHLFF